MWSLSRGSVTRQPPQSVKNTTTEFSFILKPSEHGVGVFATHYIKAGTYLRLFGDNEGHSILREKKETPEVFQEYCLDRGDSLVCPADFGQPTIGWYLNHSKDPNAKHVNYEYFALKDIKRGEEITIDYNSLEEEDNAKGDYYK